MLASLINKIAFTTGAMKSLMDEVNEFRALKTEINKARCVIEFDGNGNITNINENACKSLGYSAEELINQHHRSLLSRSDASKSEYAEFWPNLTQGKTQTGTFRLLSKQSEGVWFQGYYAPVHSETEGLRKVVAYLTDISKEKSRTILLQGEEEALNLSFGVMECDMQGNILSCNPLFLKPLGYQESELIGQHVQKILPTEVADSQDYKNMWVQLNEGKNISREICRIAKNGEKFWFQSTYVTIKDESDKPFKVLVYSYCITAEKLKNADYQAQLKAISKIQGIIEFDLKGNILEVNDNFAAVTGYSREDIIGKHHSMFVTAEYKNSADYKAFWEKLARGEPDENLYHRVGKGGKDIWLQASYNPIQDLDGKAYKVVKYATDVTKTVLNEQEQAKKAIEATMIKNSLESSVSNLMVADNDGVITYMNPSTLALMKEFQPELKKIFPNFDAEKLIGQNFDIFHKNPAHQRNLLGNLKERHVAEMPVGGLFIRLTANPIFDNQGQRLGSVVEWVNLTDEKRVENEIKTVVENAANGNLAVRLDSTKVKGSMAKTMDSVNQLLDAFNAILLQVREASETINTAALEISSGNNDLSSRTEQQASSLEETASSMEELASTVKQNAENAKQANQMAEAASQVAIKGGEVVGDVVTTMSAINESARKIEDIITVIDGIAFQTNILALNAAVEAARAGEQGRGFAVVAGEVRNLAQRSASAAKEIKELISDSVAKVEDGTKLVENAGATMHEIVTSVQRVTDIMSEITAASAEQSSGIDQVNDAVTNMDEVTQQNAALVEQAAAAAESLVEQANGLMETVGMFKLLGATNINTGSKVTLQRPSSAQTNSKPVDKPKTKAPQASARERVSAKTGTDDTDWEEF